MNADVAITTHAVDLPQNGAPVSTLAEVARLAVEPDRAPTAARWALRPRRWLELGAVGFVCGLALTVLLSTVGCHAVRVPEVKLDGAADGDYCQTRSVSATDSEPQRRAATTTFTYRVSGATGRAWVTLSAPENPEINDARITLREVGTGTRPREVSLQKAVQVRLASGGTTLLEVTVRPRLRSLFAPARCPEGCGVRMVVTAPFGADAWRQALLAALGRDLEELERRWRQQSGGQGGTTAVEGVLARLHTDKQCDDAAARQSGEAARTLVAASAHLLAGTYTPRGVATPDPAALTAAARAWSAEAESAAPLGPATLAHAHALEGAAPDDALWIAGALAPSPAEYAAWMALTPPLADEADAHARLRYARSLAAGGAVVLPSGRTIERPAAWPRPVTGRVCYGPGGQAPVPDSVTAKRVVESWLGVPGGRVEVGAPGYRELRERAADLLCDVTYSYDRVDKALVAAGGGRTLSDIAAAIDAIGTDGLEPDARSAVMRRKDEAWCKVFDPADLSRRIRTRRDYITFVGTSDIVRRLDEHPMLCGRRTLDGAAVYQALVTRYREVERADELPLAQRVAVLREELGKPNVADPRLAAGTLGNDIPVTPPMYIGDDEIRGMGTGCNVGPAEAWNATFSGLNPLELTGPGARRVDVKPSLHTARIDVALGPPGNAVVELASCAQGERVAVDITRGAGAGPALLLRSDHPFQVNDRADLTGRLLPDLQLGGSYQLTVRLDAASMTTPAPAGGRRLFVTPSANTQRLWFSSLAVAEE